MWRRRSALALDLKVYVGLKTLEDLDYEALHLEMTLEACSTHGSLLHLEVTFGWCLGGFVYTWRMMTLEARSPLGLVATFGGFGVWVWRLVCHEGLIIFGGLSVHLRTTFRHLSFEDLVYAWRVDVWRLGPWGISLVWLLEAWTMLS